MNNAAFNGYTPSGFNRRLPTVDENRRDDARTKTAPHSLVRRANAFFYRAILKDVSSAVDGLGNASGGRASSSGIVISNLPFLHIPVKGDDFIAVRIAVVRNVQLYCVQIEDNGPLIIDMMARITKLRRSDGLRRGKMHFEQGEVVLARFSGDRKLYRASVITRVDSNEYRVFFLDYGNMEKVLVEDMYELNDEYLLTTPPQAVFVELDGVSRSELSREQFVTYFINRTVGIRLC
ncbi:unnamed protein product [Anisakis simplex]|uniref:Tudor domain-containing protein n=1 Tax=Anisakis simplex TaxID=6269 RepID=A0A0M3KCY7_ANISI|nr:unnamed protein product [Anisakis simplex]